MRAKRAQKGGVKPSWTRARRAQEGGCRNHMQASSCLQNRPISAHFPKNPLLPPTTRPVRPCCENVGCSTISRILTFAHGLAGRGVSNHVITGRQGRGVLQPGASAARAGRGVSKHRASEASAEGGGQCVCRKTTKSGKSVGPFHQQDSHRRGGVC